MSNFLAALWLTAFLAMIVRVAHPMTTGMIDPGGDTATSESQEPDVGESQHDSLRTRIAAVADRIIREGIHVDLPTSVMADDLADAVIRELKSAPPPDFT